MIRFIILLLLPLAVFSQKKNRNDFYAEDESVNLFAFIGEKISIEEFDPNENNKVTKIEIDTITGDTSWVVTTSYCMDRAFNAKYKVVEPFFNKLPGDTVTFTVYDHYGRPDFENYNNVILYISKYDDGVTFYHQKYQFDPVYKDKKGTWTGIFVFRGVMDLRDNSKAKYFKIKTRIFDEDISNYDKQYIEIAFPKPYYKIRNNIATPVLGATVEELFRLKKEGVFKSSNLF